MGDFDNAVRAARTAQDAGTEIDDATARTIASMYHSGQASVSYSFVSTGRIPATADDLWRDLWPDHALPHLTAEERLLLSMFGTYCLNRSDRGPVEGWSRLWVSA